MGLRPKSPQGFSQRQGVLTQNDFNCLEKVQKTCVLQRAEDFGREADNPFTIWNNFLLLHKKLFSHLIWMHNALNLCQLEYSPKQTEQNINKIYNVAKITRITRSGKKLDQISWHLKLICTNIQEQPFSFGIILSLWKGKIWNILIYLYI